MRGDLEGHLIRTFPAFTRGKAHIITYNATGRQMNFVVCREGSSSHGLVVDDPVATEELAVKYGDSRSGYLDRGWGLSKSIGLKSRLKFLCLKYVISTGALRHAMWYYSSGNDDDQPVAPDAASIFVEFVNASPTPFHAAQNAIL